MWPRRLVLAQNGLRPSPWKSISNSTIWFRRHKNVTNVYVTTQYCSLNCETTRNLWDTYLKNCICTDYYQRISKKCEKMANFWDEDDSHLSNRQTEKLLTTVRMSRFKIQSLSFAWPWKIWVRDKRVLRRKPKAKVAMLRLFREEHKYSLALDTSFRLHCRESPIEAYLKERRRRTRRPWKIRFRSFFRHLFDSPRRRHLELPKRC